MGCTQRWRVKQEKVKQMVEDRRQKRGEHSRLCLEENIIAAHAHIER